jgi:hypothetical protein
MVRWNPFSCRALCSAALLLLHALAASAANCTGAFESECGTLFERDDETLDDSTFTLSVKAPLRSPKYQT